MRYDGLVRAALVMLVAGLAGGGLYFVGGPQTGRTERRDATRLADLMALSSFMICVANAGNGTFMVFAHFCCNLLMFSSGVPLRTIMLYHCNVPKSFYPSSVRAGTSGR